MSQQCLVDLCIIGPQISRDVIVVGGLKLLHYLFGLVGASLRPCATVSPLRNLIVWDLNLV